MDRATVGRWGERVAALHLQARGYRVLFRSWRAGRAGEIDLVVRRGRILALVEVRTSRGRGFGRPEESVGRHKQARMVRAAEMFLASLPPRSPLRGLQPRLDVIAVERRRPGWWSVRHLEGAVDATQGGASVRRT